MNNPNVEAFARIVDTMCERAVAAGVYGSRRGAADEALQHLARSMIVIDGAALPEADVAAAYEAAANALDRRIGPPLMGHVSNPGPYFEGWSTRLDIILEARGHELADYDETWFFFEHPDDLSPTAAALLLIGKRLDDDEAAEIARDLAALQDEKRDLERALAAARERAMSDDEDIGADFIDNRLYEVSKDIKEHESMLTGYNEYGPPWQRQLDEEFRLMEEKKRKRGEDV